MVLNNGRYLTDVNIKFLSLRGITRILTGWSRLFTFVMQKLLFLCSNELDVLIHRLIGLNDMVTIINRVLGRESVYSSPTTASASPTYSSVSRSSLAPLNTATISFSFNTRDVAIYARVAVFHYHKEVINMAHYCSKVITEGH